MRPLIVMTGQGIARADGFNLTRRMKATPRLASLTGAVRRRDRQNLDALLESCAAGGGDALTLVLQDLRSICLKERRTTLRKTAHRELFAALAEVAGQRLVAHLTTNVDGLTTTFAVRDFGACWPPFREPVAAADVIAEMQQALDRRTGMLHFPVHGEAGLVTSDGPGEILQTFYGSPRAVAGHAVWLPSLAIGAAAGIAGLEQRLLPARLGYLLLDALLTPGAPTPGGLTVPESPAADLLVIGYGAEEGGTRDRYPFESRITRLVAAGGRDPGTRWTALVHRPEDNAPTASWYAARGFTVLPYDDGELTRVVRQALTRPLPGARCAPEVASESRLGQDLPRS